MSEIWHTGMFSWPCLVSLVFCFVLCCSRHQNLFTNLHTWERQWILLLNFPDLLHQEVTLPQMGMSPRFPFSKEMPSPKQGPSTSTTEQWPMTNEQKAVGGQKACQPCLKVGPSLVQFMLRIRPSVGSDWSWGHQPRWHLYLAPTPPGLLPWPPFPLEQWISKHGPQTTNQHLLRTCSICRCQAPLETLWIRNPEDGAQEFVCKQAILVILCVLELENHSLRGYPQLNYSHMGPHLSFCFQGTRLE